MGALLSQRISAAIKEGGPDKLSDTKSLGTLIQEASDRPVHIIYVHGMRATGAGASALFRKGLCKYVGDGCRLKPGFPTQGLRSERFDIGEYPEDAAVVDQKIWPTDAAWSASRPFVDRFVYVSSSGKQIVVDEVNWWPLLFPLKCRFLLLPDANLSGADLTDLGLCAKGDDPFYAWIDSAQLDSIKSSRPASGGGALINAALKQQIMNWGLSDAVMAVGPLQKYFRRAMNAAFDYAAQYDGKSVGEQDFAVISESLGSFVVLDAFATPEASFVSANKSIKPASSGVHDVLTQTFYLYFFANQFAMLELARIEGLGHATMATAAITSSPQASASLQASVSPQASSSSASPLRALRSWALEKSQRPNRPELERAGKYAQIIAFSDPSDMLTFNVPAIANSKVVNVYDRNSFRWFGLIENPSKAHTGHSSNPDVLKTMFEH
jgi:hypothetical protein